MKSFRSRRLLTAFLVLVLLLGQVIPVFAVSLEDDPGAQSSTNPWDRTDPATWWREGWSNSLYPDITFSKPPADPSPFPGKNSTLPTLGFVYRIDRLAHGVPDTSTGDPFLNLSPQNAGSLMFHRFDLQGVLDKAPADQWGYVPSAGQSVPIEGPWYLHARFFNYLRIQQPGTEDGTQTCNDYRLNVDVTPPQPVTGFTAGAAAAVTPSKRRVFSWDNKEYDALSGVAMFRVLVNGVEKAMVPYLPLMGMPTALTIEDLPEGASYVEIQAMDRATNLSAPMGEWQYVDSAGARVAVTSPARDGEALTATYTFSADATDAVGVKDVRFVIDGTTVATDTTAPYTLTYDTRALSDGAHQLQVFADDFVGRFAQATRFFTVSNVVIPPPPPPTTIESTPVVSVQGIDVENGDFFFTNALRPAAAFSSINASTLPDTTGYFYVVDRSPSTVPTTGSDHMPSAGDGTGVTLDLPGYARTFPSAMASGESTTVEGDWNIHLRTYVSTFSGLSAVTAHGRFGVDVTPPRPVEELSVDTTGWTNVYRHRLTWKDKVYERFGSGSWVYPFNKGYDALSGDKYWVMTVNGGTPKKWPRYAFAPYASVTVQDGLHPGDNVVGVQVEDAAGNLSAPSYAHILIDDGAPTFTIVSPRAGETIYGRYTFTIDARDDAGVSLITFAIDGNSRQSSKSQQMSLDTASLANGAHRLDVTVRDAAGNITMQSRDFVVDNQSVPASTSEASPTVTLNGFDIQDPTKIYFTRSLVPQAAFGIVYPQGAEQIPPTGFYYTVDRRSNTIPTVSSDHTPKSPITLNMNDLGRVHPSDGSGGASKPVEGDDWNIHVRSYNASDTGLSAVTAHGHFGVDITPPAAVLGLKSDASGWTTSYRHKLTWRDRVYEKFGAGSWTYPFTKGYDALSGDHTWVLTINGGNPIEWERFTGAPFATASIEEGLKPGKNTVSIRVRDYAGNLSAPANAYFYIDSDTPALSITAPAASQWLAEKVTFKAKATDAAGISKVTFKIDGVVRQATTSQSLAFDTKNLRYGKHTLEVTARDMYGHTRTVSRTFNVDNGHISVTSIGDSPDPFYPVLKDGYKDTSTIGWSMSESAPRTYLQIYNASGSKVREYAFANLSSGRHGVSWDGKDSSGAIATGTFYYRIATIDKANNWTITTKYPTTIRDYEIVYVSPGKVKIVPR